MKTKSSLFFLLTSGLLFFALYAGAEDVPVGQFGGGDGRGDAMAEILGQTMDSITVTSPNGAESWTAGSSHDITWTSTGTVGVVNIVYTTDNGGSWNPVVNGTENDGSYTWTVPSTPSTTCLVQVSEGADDNPADQSDAVFTIVAIETVSAPSQPGGANSGLRATSYPFTTGGSTSSLGHSVQYKLDWDDGTTSGWLATGTTSASHRWSASGTYNVQAMARCAEHTAIESLWSEVRAVVIIINGGSGFTCDFNNDGKTDIAWQNTSTGRNIAWYMDGVARTASVYLPSQDTAWTIVGCPDFNDDGNTDILFWNLATGRNIVWHMNGVTRTSSVYLPTQNTAWANAGFGDFNGDGMPDMLWRNLATGRNIVWYMNDVTRTGSVYLPTQDTAWTLAGCADFNADGKTDIMWWNAATGRNICWYMDGVARTGSVYMPSQDTAWENAGSGDFNGDGKPDILWRNMSTGRNIVWYMDGVTRIDSVYLPTQADLDWKLSN